MIISQSNSLVPSMASCTSNHFILIVLFSFLFIIKTSSSFGNHSSTDGILPFAPKHVVINKLKTQAKLIAHCRNKEKDLGVKELFPGSSFDFRFRVNLRKTTRYTCTFEWSGPSGNKVTFDIFRVDRDDTPKSEFGVCRECIWYIYELSPCRLDRHAGIPYCFDWNS